MFYLSSSNLYKNFIKESDNKTINIDDDEKNFSQSRLSKKNKIMSGEEIKKFYDDTINKISERNSNNCDKKIIKIESDGDDKGIINNNLNSIEINVNKILKAVEQGDIDYLIKHLNKENVNNIFDNYGWTPLMSAAYCGNKLIVEFLLKLNANKEYKNKCGLTAIKLAKKNNFNNIIELLENDKEFLSKNLNINDNYNDSWNFYCKICNKNYKETTVKQHEASIIHNLNKNFELPPAFNSYGLSKQNKGYQIMLNNGWDDRKGLGPTGTGFKYPVKTILKRDRKGLGKKPFDKPRITHFKSNDINAITHIKQSKININSSKKILRKKDREKIINKMRKKDREIRIELS
ncbi:G patch domain and ankyrin repeat-containing protein 1 homolog isoform X1 [Microplitis mediator]|uniref:G patch domain and ankyrin repeat-containing protein 1 homolog isoform X1 n=1 Tax=Microplitis mediator TaxID=375433 RepID=UPI002556B613|nr:G patch domain and ankyrin repeat-containing protein 1 homolog isoform X1 [Microplitis mediator]XP_057323911.1 G patch domain and ankyrin repeat-containing protein 1 homolog isoform X1 [Microplitis mediator]